MELSTNSAPFVCTRRPIARRTLLRSAGVLLGLPFLEAMAPALSLRKRGLGPRDEVPHRMLAICNNLGFLSKHFFPTEPGRGYALSPYLELLRDQREDFTVFSGSSHPHVDGGHASDVCFLTGAPNPASGGFRNRISLDQFAADEIGHLTRLPSLTLGVNVLAGMRSLSWTGTGALIPCEEKASEVFKRLFLQGSAQEVQAQIRRLDLGQSIMEAIGDQARNLEQELGQRDRERLDQYLTGVRDLEKRMKAAKEWAHEPKPVVSAPVPVDPESPDKYMEKVARMYDIARLALETDSTRLITLMLDGVNSPAIEVPGVEITDSYHNLSHHGNSEVKLAQLEGIDRMHMHLLAGLLQGLGSTAEGERSTLARTMVLYGSNMGNANTHETTRIPVLLAGGGFKHGQHIVADPDKDPLPNLFVSMLQRLGLEVDRFASSTGTMRGLEPA